MIAYGTKYYVGAWQREECQFAYIRVIKDMHKGV